MKKKIIIILIFIFILSLVGLLVINPVLFVGKINEDNIGIDKSRLYLDVKNITEIEPARNYKNINSLNKAADYIVNIFKGLDCGLEIQKFKVENNEYKNIICSFGSEHNERVIVGAHYDVYGNQEGADDNASGVAGLLEIARLININQPDLNYRIDLIAFTLEEPLFFRTDNMGSAIHAKSLSEKDLDIKGMISLEMIGYYTDKPNSQKYPSPLLKIIYPSKGDFIAVVGKFGQGGFVKKIKKEMKRVSKVDVWSINAPALIPGIDFSDHLNYWDYGYNAVMITDTSFYRNNNYHENTDTINTLDFDKMSEVIKGVYWAIISL